MFAFLSLKKNKKRKWINRVHEQGNVQVQPVRQDKKEGWGTLVEWNPVLGGDRGVSEVGTWKRKG